MPEKGKSQGFIHTILHQGHKIVEVDLSDCSFEESKAVIGSFAARLERMPEGEKIQVLTNFQDAVYDTRLPLAWKAQLALFGKHIQRSAIIGVPLMGRTMVQGYAETAELRGESLGTERAVLFPSRVEALDWLAGNEPAKT